MGFGFCDGFYGFSSEKISLRAYREFLKKTITTHHGPSRSYRLQGRAEKGIGSSSFQFGSIRDGSQPEAFYGF